MFLQVHQPSSGVPTSPLAGDDALAYARGIIRSEASALELVAGRLDASFLQAVELLHRCTGRVAVTGTGKSADVGQKITGTLNSTGTRAYLMDATRAVHGDLGMIGADDVVILLSHSGESEEIVRLLTPLKELAGGLVGITGNSQSTLARRADVTVSYGPLEEICPLGLAPSTSTTAMIALGDALAFVLSRKRQFTREDFARYHPAGSLGRQFLKVEDLMRNDDELRIAAALETVRQVFAHERRRGRRTGAIMLTDEKGQLCGIFTDSDLARLFEQYREDALDRPIAEVMTPQPLAIQQGARLHDALAIIRRHKISELPVVDGENRPVGLIDITDLIGLRFNVGEQEGEVKAKRA